MLRLALIEDTPAIRQAFTEYLSAQPEFEFVAEAGSVEEFLAMLPHLPAAPQLILSDIELPGKSGIEGIGLIRPKLPKAEVVMISVYSDAERVFQALCAGAVGYLIKNTPLPTLKESLLQVAAGGSPMSPSVARHVIRYFQPRPQAEEKLTPREQQIVQGIEDGLSYKLIAARLHISIDTVRNHIRQVYQKLQVNSKAEIMARARRRWPL
ncbi:response regulator [Hymenobacter guriensis]|uniref:Response regulator transcription factor n=1 Tax=Hymenobacter guriensis TaxID=2793065 RepID=A0ABS0L2I4_9BACT|nr:response regulator transcription factor [Hymenobacter guriensis]MBG8554334.1 response regulator transcription factor [Hymenobacter guriensis]